MHFDKSNILVTGGAGFIGSALIRHLLDQTGANVINVDRLTYASNPQSLAQVDRSRYVFEKVDICNALELRRVFENYKPQAVVHLAAETHVDRSIEVPDIFVQTNVVGTFTLLQEALRHWRASEASTRRAFRFLHVSTDEVFGSLDQESSFTEASAYAPNSPYAATKASSDHLVRAWGKTYGLPVIITNCSNNYGPYHFPEKFIPQMIVKGLTGEQLPVYGNGGNIRDWLFVDDHARALEAVLQHGAAGETFTIGAGNERTNLSVAEAVCDLLDRLQPSSFARRQLISFVKDRPGHDRRYAVDPSKLEAALGWRAQEDFESGLEKTVRWYIDNQQWWRAILAEGYGRARIGLTV
jgi:dTDP-glucose 4,6-dehydratase